MLHRTGRTGRTVLIAVAVMLATAAGCVNVFWRTEAAPLQPPPYGAPLFVSTPIKVHMKDGSTVLFRAGARVDTAEIEGAGVRYPLLSDTAISVTRVRTDSIAAVETFENKVVAAPTLLVTAAATAAGVVGTAGLAIAIFGSCPTVYADSGAGLSLQAEGFSYAIAPLFEHRDVDPLRVRPDADGIIRLELRNEALETHFINHLELAAVRHAPGVPVIPDQGSRPVALREIRPLDVARDRAGRDVRADLAASDGRLFASTSAIVNSARPGDLHDWIDIEATDVPAGDSVAVVLRLRNSLLNTVLLYEGMLGGPDALDWLGTGLQQINTVIELARWYRLTMGMHATIVGAKGDSTSVRLSDVGPIAFRDVAIVLPRPADSGRVRVRLRFVADNWRIDHAAIAGVVTRPSIEWLPVSRVIVPSPEGGGAPVVEHRAAGMLAQPDDKYLETRPGQRLTLEFAKAATDGGDSATTYLIAWQGWYREWIRGDWIANPRRYAPFVPGDEAVLTALRRWSATKQEYERAFYASRLPVR